MHPRRTSISEPASSEANHDLSRKAGPLMRRTETIVAVAIAVAFAITGASSVALAQPAARGGAQTAAAGEQQQLQALYEKAKAEGGKLTVYVGGDAPGQWDFIAQAFAAQFPDVQLHFVTD